MATVTLLTDFGLRDEYVGVMEGVIAGLAPGARVIHVTHGIAPQAVLQGALALERAVPYLPVGVHVAVVDPGVGSSRLAVALRTADGRTLVGPDNGLLLRAADGAGGVVEARAIANADLFLEPLSATFHGRDVFAPVAAHLAAGLAFAAVGPAIEPASLVRLVVPEPVVGDGRLGAVALGIDRFGNVALNASGRELDAAGLVGPGPIEVDAGGTRVHARRAPTFGDARAGEVVVFDDASGRAALAVASGSFVDVCPVALGDAVLLSLVPSA